MKESTEIINGSLDNKLFTRSFINPSEQAKIIIVHGIGEHSGRYNHITKVLYSAGYSVYLYDHIGHGRSEGTRGYIPSWDIYRKDLELFIKTKKIQDSNMPSFIFGQSMGGLIVIDYLNHNPNSFDAAIVSSPALDNSKVPKIIKGIFRLLNKISPKLSLKSPLEFDEISRDPNEVNRYKNDPLNHFRISPRHAVEFLNAIDRISKIHDKIKLPILITHGEDDGIVGIAGTKDFFSKLKNQEKKLITYPNGKHESHNDIGKEEAISNILKWFNKHI